MVKKYIGLSIVLACFLGCSDGKFSGTNGVASKNKRSSGNDTSSTNPQTETEDGPSQSGENSSGDSNTAVVATLPDNVAGSYLSCVSTVDPTDASTSTMGCVVFDSKRSTKLNLAGMNLEWEIFAKDTGVNKQIKEKTVSYQNKVQALLEIASAELVQGVYVQVKITGVDSHAEVKGEFPDPNIAQIPFMASIDIQEEVVISQKVNNRHIVFVTRQKYGPGPVNNEIKFNRVTGADNLCAKEAAFDGLSGPYSWKAVIGDSSASPSDRISIMAPVFQIKKDGKDEALFTPSDPASAKNHNLDFFNAKLSIFYGSNGSPAFAQGDSSEAKIWTGSNSTGQLPEGDDFSCNDWSSPAASEKGNYALSDSPEKWLRDGEASCKDKLRLLCISQISN